MDFYGVDGEMKYIALDKVVWDPKVYPRRKWTTSTIERYADALLAGDTFPPIAIEKGTNILLDGKHRLDSRKLAVEMLEKPVETDVTVKDLQQINIEYHVIPEGMSKRYYAATLSARHGDRLKNSDVEELAKAEFEADPSIDPREWGKLLGVSKTTIYRYVAHIVNRYKTERETWMVRLSRLGWTQKEIAKLFDVSQQAVSEITNNSQLGKIGNLLGETWNDESIADLSSQLSIPLVDTWSAALDGNNDQERMKLLGIKVQPYDVWNFSGCHDLMGDQHPGRIPGQLVAHVLYFYTKQGDLVVDPMAGSGTTLDACSLMGRKARGYDIDGRHERCDIGEHDLTDGWPEITSKATLVFWDPPYFDKMDAANIGEDGYIEGSISGMDPDEYLEWLSTRFAELHNTGAKQLAFLMSNWDSQNAKRHKGHKGLFSWDYAYALEEAGWTLTREIQCPLPTQQVHPVIVNKFRESRRMARLTRSLIIAKR